MTVTPFSLGGVRPPMRLGHPRTAQPKPSRSVLGYGVSGRQGPVAPGTHSVGRRSRPSLILLPELREGSHTGPH